MNSKSKHYDVRQPLNEHLDELRVRLIRFGIIFIVIVIACWIKSDFFFNFLMHLSLEAAKQANVQFIVTDILDRFWISFKVTLLCAVVVTLPYMLFEIYQFLKPGLKSNERRLIVFIFLSIPFLFLSGFSLWYFYALPESIDVLLKIGNFPVLNHINLLSLLSFSLLMGIIFGALFQLPLLMIALVKLRILSMDTIKKYRRHTYIVLCILSGVITPSPDAFSMLVLWVPLIVLYEITLVFTQYIKPFGQNDD